MTPVIAVLAAWTAIAAPVAAESSPVFYKDVLPILQKHCQACHRQGEISPMPLTTFNEVRPWAKDIRETVTLRKMPPWFANPKFGRFANDPSLTAGEMQTIQAWVEAGAPEGSPSEAPAPVHWESGWNISPDIIFSMPEPFRIPAKATIGYQYLIIPTHFSMDRWVKAVEIRPSDRRVVHDAVLYLREPGSSWLRDVPPGILYAPPATGDRNTNADILAIYSPGAPAMVCPPGMAKKIAAGSDLVLQLHYTSVDTAAQDQSDIGITMMNGEPKARVLTLQMGSDNFVIPPGARDHRVSVSGAMPRDALLLSLFPHMHLRGSEFEYVVTPPGGTPETLLDVKPWNFSWQLNYQLETPRTLHRGDRLTWIGHFDNSPNNPANPDPTAEVRWGEQSWQETMVGYFDVAVEPDVDKARFFAARSGGR
ncbi:MAG: thiol-disulfide isomerase [Bryobacteraceae bacterium]